MHTEMNNSYFRLYYIGQKLNFTFITFIVPQHLRYLICSSSDKLSALLNTIKSVFDNVRNKICRMLPTVTTLSGSRGVVNEVRSET